MCLLTKNCILALCLNHIFLNTEIASMVINAENTSENSVYQCMSDIYHKYYTDHTIIISYLNQENTIVDFNNRTIVRYSTTDLNFPANFWKYNFFLLIINEITDYQNIIESLQKFSIINTRGYFTVAYFGEEDIGDIFEISWRYFIYNINVIYHQDNTSNIYTYFPYKDGLCGNYTTYERLSSCDELRFDMLYSEKIPNDLKGCQIQLMAYPMIPYVINISAARENSREAGVEVTIVHVLSQRMNFTQVFVPHKHPFWGFKDLDGKYQMMFGSLYNKSCEVIFGMTFGNASHVIDFDGAFVHLMDRSVWFVPVALPIPQWKNLTAIFEGDVWLAIFVVFLVNGIAWWVIGRSRETSLYYNNLTLSIIASLYCLLQGSVDSPNTWRLRAVFIIWLMTCLLLFTAHQCQLVSILTSPIYEHQIDSLEEVVNSTLEVGMFIGAALGYIDDYWVHVEVIKRYIQCPLSNLCLNRTAFQRDIATLRNLRNARYFFPRYYTDPNGKLLLYQIKDDSLGIWARFYTLKGFPLLDRFNNLMMLMQASGLIAKWDADIGVVNPSVDSESELEPLTIGHLQGAFYILFIGMLIALLVLFCEIMKKKIKG